jgi:septal ring factor EnvC (AmiA/AmiB activator)
MTLPRFPRPRLNRLVLCSAAALLAFALACPASAANNATQKKHELFELKGRIDNLKREIESAQGDKADVLDDLKESEQSISEINKTLHDLSQQRESVNGDLTELRRQTEAVKARIEDQRARLAKLLVEQYQSGSQDSLRLVLNQQDPNALSRDMEYYGYIARARGELIASLKSDLAEAEEAERATREKSAELTRIHEKQRNEKKALEKEAATRRTTLARLDKKISERRKQVKKLEQDERRLTRLIERLAQAIAAKARAARPRGGPPSGEFANLKGRLKLPVAGAITNRFGAPRPETGVPWKGIFIRAPEGSQVKALASGRVVFADWLRGFGNLLIIDHDNGYMSLYGDNESLYKQVGDSVRAGDVVAAAGNSGGNAESGLYFEVRFRGKPVDPLPWVGAH